MFQSLLKSVFPSSTSYLINASLDSHLRSDTSRPRFQTSLSLAVQSKLIDTLLSALQAEIDQSSRSQLSDDPSSHLAHKEPLERYAFLIQWFITGAEKAAIKGDGDVGPAGKKSKGAAKAKKTAASGRKGDWVWEQAIPGVLKDLGKALKLKTDRIWTTTQERDTFIKCASCRLDPPVDP